MARNKQPAKPATRRAKATARTAEKRAEPYRHPEAETPCPPATLIDAVVAYFKPRRVILFGSHARGEAGPDSDYDLLVVVDEDTPLEKLRLAAGYESRRAYRGPADVVPCRESTFQRRARLPGTLCHAAATEGVVIYERR